MQVPISTLHLFPILDKKLFDFLGSLSSADWQKPTIAKLWTVKDIASHLLDGNFRTLSFSRDRHLSLPTKPINSYGDLVSYLNELNADWVTAMKRVSPQVLINLLESTGKEFHQHLTTLDPYADAMFSVVWAGEQTSKNWFHIAREYTEKFIHQQQIRNSFDNKDLFTKELFYPFIDTMMYGLPHTYRDVKAEKGTEIQVNINTEIGGDWFLLKTDIGWKLSKEKSGNTVTIVEIDPDTAWKLFSKGITPEKANENTSIIGDEKLGSQVLNMVSVMA